MWSKTYLVAGRTMDEAAVEVEARLGIQLRRRYTSYGGPYYVWRDEPSELFVKNNVIDGGELTGGELTYPSVPEGVFVTANTEHEAMFGRELDSAEGFELFEVREFGQPKRP